MRVGNKVRRTFELSWATLFLLFLGCGAEKVDTLPDVQSDVTPEVAPVLEFEMEGTWKDPSGQTGEISAQKWGADAIYSFDNEHNIAITQAPGDKTDFKVIVWTDIVNDSVYFCFVDFGLENSDEAMAIRDLWVEGKELEARVHDENPELEGCNGFPWTLLVRVEREPVASGVDRGSDVIGD